MPYERAQDTTPHDRSAEDVVALLVENVCPREANRELIAHSVARVDVKGLARGYVADEETLAPGEAIDEAQSQPNPKTRVSLIGCSQVPSVLGCIRVLRVAVEE